MATLRDGLVNPLVKQLPIDTQAFVTTNGDRVFEGDRVLEYGHAIYVSARDPQTKQQGIAAVDVTSGRVSSRLLVHQDLGGIYKTLIAASSHGASIVYVAQDATHPWDIWRVNATLTHPRQLTHLNPGFERYHYGQARLLRWSDADGQSYQGALLLPSRGMSQDIGILPLFINIRVI